MVRLPTWLRRKKRERETDAVDQRLENMLHHHSTLPEDIQVKRRSPLGRRVPPAGSSAYYMMLGLPPDATQTQVEQAYRKYVAVIHPDRFAHNPALQEHQAQVLRDLNTFMAQMRKMWAEESSKRH